MTVRKRLAIAIAETLEPRRLLANIGPDVNFADGGDADVGADTFLASLPNGKILAVENSTDPKRVARLNADGSLDSSFGDGGFAAVTLEDATESAAISGTHLILAGAINATQVSVEALNLDDGSEDLSFGQHGSVSVSSNDNDAVSVTVTSMAAGPSGTTYIAFDSFAQDSDDGSFSGGSQIARLTSAGDLDSRFGNGGYVTALSGSTVAADPDGGVIAIGGDADSHAKLLRFDADGAVNFNFNINAGSTLPGVSLGGDLSLRLGLQSNGKIVVGGTSVVSDVDDPEAQDPIATLVRLTDAGKSDSTFGSAGIAKVAGLTTASAVAIDASDRILIGSDSSITRLTADGKADDSFNGGNVVDLGKNIDVFTLASDAAGRVLVGDSDEQTLRLAPREDVSLGINGTLYIDGTASADTVSVKVSGSKVDATFNSKTSSFDASAVKSVSITGGDGDDVIDAAIDLNTTVDAGDGDDSITTAGGDDSIQAGLGDDTIHSGDGSDTIFSAKENEFQDTTTDGNNLIVTGDGDKTIRLGDGRDTVQTGVGDHTIDDSPSTAGGMFTIAGGKNNLTLRGANYDVTIGGSGNNTVFCSAGTNHITTGDGDDSITDSGDAATITGGGGNDHVIIGLFQANGPALLLDLGAGNDVAECGNGSVTANGGDGSDSIKSGTGADFLYGDAGGDTLRGGLGSDLLSGGGGRDHLFGQQGKDRIYAGNGNDAVDAGPGDDRIFGQAGDDVITAGSGNDQLTGGPGSDYLAAGPGDDTLTANDGTIDSVFGGDGNDSAATDPSLDVLRSIET